LISTFLVHYFFIFSYDPVHPFIIFLLTYDLNLAIAAIIIIITIIVVVQIIINIIFIIFEFKPNQISIIIKNQQL